MSKYEQRDNFCASCCRWLSRTLFGQNKSRSSGLSAYCRDCARSKQRASYERRIGGYSCNAKRLSRLSAEERFEASHEKVPIGGCWIWTGAENGGNGYGRIKVHGRAVPAHRFSYERANGPIPAGMVVMHSCDTPMCVNPHHLSIGTVADNNADKVRKNRQARGAQLSELQRAGWEKRKIRVEV